MTQLQPVKIRLISLFDEELARKMSLDECSWSSVSHVLPCVSVYQWMFTPICERWTGAQACVCVCALPLHASWCVCVCVNKPLFVCGFGWRPLPLLLSEYGQVAVYVWMWHLCAVILLCGLPMLHWSKRLSLHHWHTHCPGVEAILTFCCSLIIHTVNYCCAFLHHPNSMWKEYVWINGIHKTVDKKVPGWPSSAGF